MPLEQLLALYGYAPPTSTNSRRRGGGKTGEGENEDGYYPTKTDWICCVIKTEEQSGST